MEHGDAGHRRHHPDRRDGGADPAAQRRRAVVVRRARLQVHDPDRVAGARPRDRGAGRGRQPPGEEGRRAVPHRPDALPARREHARGAARQRVRARSASSRSQLEGRLRQDRRSAQRDRAGGEHAARSARGSTSRASASSSTASWRRPAPATGSTSSGPRPTCSEQEGQLDAARSAEAQARAAAQATAASSRSSRSSAPRSNGEFAQVAQIRAQLENARWQLGETTTRSPCDCYVVNLQLRPGGFVAGLPLNPVMTLVEADGQVVALYNQNELHQVDAGQRGRVRAEDAPGPDHQGQGRLDRLGAGPGTAAGERHHPDDRRDGAAARPLRGEVRHRRARQGALPRRRRGGRRRDLHRPPARGAHPAQGDPARRRRT